MVRAGTVAVLALGAVACQVPSAEKFAQLQRGMTETEVAALLGKPSSKHAASMGPGGVTRVPACWQYGDNLSTLATGAMFKDQPASDRVWAIYFDAEGRVTTWQRPSWDQ